MLYRVGGREFLVLDPNEPLPQVVMDDINGRVAAMTMSDDPVATLVSLEAETGKRFVLVDHCPLCTLGPYEELREIWTVYVSTGALTTGLSSWDEGLGFADDFVSSQPAPEQWVIVQKG